MIMRLLGIILLAAILQAGCTESDEDVSTEELLGDQIVEQEVDQKAQSLKEAADEAVAIMKEDISTSSAPVEADSAVGND
jgi:PBP1b-binding outer membrane lipoprotein LpoB